MPNGNLFNSRSGMTLVEVMVALLLLCTGVTAVAVMLSVSIQGNAKSRRGVEDTITAAVMIERILALPYDDPMLEDRDDGFKPQDPDHGPMEVTGRSSTIEWEVDNEFPARNTKRVLITVRNRLGHDVGNGHRYDYVKTKSLHFFSAGKDVP